MNAAAGANSIAIGSAQTSTSDGASSGATVASGNSATAIGVKANAAGLNSIALGSAASASAEGSAALGNSASASGVGSTALGRRAVAAAASAVAVGDGASAQTASAVAIGAGATALGGKAVSIGAGNTANGNGAVAIGDPNTAAGTGAVAMGANNSSNGQGAVALGNANTATGQGAVALGNSSTAGGGGAIALGDTAAANTTKALALGSGATATNQNDVALGAGSVTATPNATSGATIAGTFYSFAGTSPTSVVSVGASGSERQITNVAAGRISATSTDAINGSQLYATNQAVTAVQQVANAGWNVTTSSTGTGTVSGTTVQKIAPGATATFTAGNNIAVTQNGAEVQIATSMTPSFTSVTTGNTTMNSSGLTINGGPSVTSSGIDAGGTKITNVAAGTNPTDAVNLTQMQTAVTNVQTHYYSVNDGGTQQANYANNGATGTNSLAAGVAASAAGASAVAVGNTASAQITNGVAIGPNATAANGNGAVAIGYQSVAYGTLAIGQNANATGGDSIAIGKSNGATGIGSIAIGLFANAGGQNSVALGGGSSAGTYGSMALGLNTQANASTGDVALGSGSVTAAPNPTASATINGTTYNFAGTSPTSVVSVGASGSERQITNVAAGRISASSTDAINGSQLYATNQAIDTLSQGTVKYDTSGGTVNYNKITLAGPGGTTITNVAPGAVSSTSTDAVNGSQLYAVQQLAGAGWNITTKATGTGTVSGTTVQNIAPGSTATFTAGNNIAITQVGSEIQIATSMTPSFTSVTTGNTKIDTNGLTIAGGPSVTSAGIDAGGTKITNVAAGTNATDAVNVSQMNTAVAGAKTHYYSVNDNGAQQANYANDGATGANSMAAGVAASASGAGSTAIGYGATASNAGAVALGQGSTTSAAVATTGTEIGGKAYTFAGTSPTSTVSVGAVGAERTITNVAAGRLSATSTDAINGSQLYATNQAVDVLYKGGAGPVQYSNSSTPTTPNGGTPTNDLTLVGGSSGPVVLHNVGDGAVSSTSTDAVNGKQLYATQANVPGSWQAPTSNTYVLSNPAGGGGPVTMSNVAPGTLSPTSTEAVNGSQLYATNQAINNIATGFGNLQSQIDTNARRADAGIATAAALGMVRYDDRPGKLSTGAAVTYHHNQAGFAMGAGYTTEDRLWRVSAGLAFSPTSRSMDDLTVGASATYTWN
ncbi:MULTISPECIES: YadA-like family protein [unclassified Bradyrhizobium]|uniref:beta strand repeat-containing protein n=1 Tax=unclassified Bradyrhizobium TaxID=2631580 RepID=UPI002915C58E|nr:MULTISPECIES: YadA-like family protein [unclassified Bradyrhizobium]